ncbi:MAG: alpha/beta fold hydrolase [Bacteroidales bacterium]
MNYHGIIFIHGAGLSSLIWDDVRSLIRFPALPIDYPSRKHNVADDLNFGDYINAIIKQIDRWEVEKFILVTHSIGGCLGLKVAQFFKSRIIGFVAIASAIPKKGDSFISCLPYPRRVILPLIIKVAGTRPPKKAIEKGLCSDLTREQAEKVYARFIPESKELFFEKCDAGIPDTKRLYIKLAYDRELPLPVQERMAENLKAHKILTLHSGHLPMLSKPSELVKILTRFYNEAILEMNYLKN